MKREKNKNDIRKTIQERISRGELVMHSRWYFIWRVAALYVLLGVLFFASLFLATFIGKIISEFGLLLIFSAGPQGITGFAAAFPWHLLIGTLIAVWLCLFIILRYVGSFYKIPRIFSLIGIIAILVGGAIALTEAPLAADLFYTRSDKEMRLRTFGFIWPTHAYWILGTVEDISQERIRIREERTSQKVYFLVPKALPSSLQLPDPGEKVLIEYSRTGSGFEIRSLQVIQPASDYSRSED